MSAGRIRPSLWLRLGSLYEERFRCGGDLADHRRALEIFRTGWNEGSGYPMRAACGTDVSIRGATPPLSLRIAPS